MAHLKDWQQWATAHGWRPGKVRGQNFLIQPGIARKMVAGAGIKSTDLVLEIGPGFGALSKPLLEIAQRVVSVEIDPVLSAFLNQDGELARFKNWWLIEQDFLNLDLGSVFKPGSKIKVVASLPYSVASQIIIKLLEQTEVQLETAVFLLQAEVGQRLLAQVPHYNLLAVWVQQQARVKSLGSVAGVNFWPAPRVKSEIIKLDFKEPRLDLEFDYQFFKKITKIGFACRRKQLATNLKRAGWSATDLEVVYGQLELDPKIRAQALTIAEWQQLATLLKPVKGLV